jgi:hypothetical protein
VLLDTFPFKLLPLSLTWSATFGEGHLHYHCISWYKQVNYNVGNFMVIYGFFPRHILLSSYLLIILWGQELHPQYAKSLKQIRNFSPPPTHILTHSRARAHTHTHIAQICNRRFHNSKGVKKTHLFGQIWYWSLLTSNPDTQSESSYQEIPAVWQCKMKMGIKDEKFPWTCLLVTDFRKLQCTKLRGGGVAFGDTTFKLKLITTCSKVQTDTHILWW